MTAELQHEVEQFLYREARLLDSWRLDEWLDLLTDDVTYAIPIRESRPDRPDGFVPEGVTAVHHLDEDRQGLERRVRRYDTGLAHAEIPRSRVRHHVTNVELIAGGGEELEVLSNVLLFQGRRSHADAVLSAQRHDVLRRVHGTLLLARRVVLLDHTLLPRSLSVLV